MKLKAILAPSLLAFVWVDVAWAATPGEVYSGLQDAVRKSGDLRSSLERMDADYKSDGRVIYDYYSDRKRIYLARPLQVWVDPARNVARQYTSAVSEAVLSISSSATSKTFKKDFSSCLTQLPRYGELDRAADNLVDSVLAVANKLNAPWNARSPIPPDSNAMLDAQMSGAVSVLEADWATAINSCCNSAAAQDVAERDADPDSLNKVCKQTYASLSVKQMNFRNSLPALVTVTPPNPLNISSLKPFAVAAIIKNRSLFAEAHSADEEDEVFRNIEQTCEDKRNEAQNRSMPVKQGFMLGLAKSLRCDILPSIGTAFGNLTLQRLSTGIGRAPIEGKDSQGRDWDVNCDQKTLNALDMSRPSDPATIAKNWGLDKLANPPYIESQRAMPPLTAPFPITQVPTGGYLTPFGGIGLSDPNNVGLSSNRLSVNGLPVSSGSTATRGMVSSGRRLAVSRGMTRGVVQGAALAQGARKLSSQISLGRSPLRAATTLHSGAANSRAFVSKIVSNGARFTPVQRRQAAAAKAASVRSAVRSLASSKGSRVTSEGLLGTLAGRTRTNTTSGVPGVVGAMGNLQKIAEEQRAKIETAARAYVNNINLALQKANDTRLRIQQLVADYDLAIQKGLGDMITASPRKQSDMATKVHRETTNIVKEIASLKTQLDVYRASILEQSSMLQTLQVFGPKNAKYPTPNNTGRAGSSTSASLGSMWRMPTLLRSLFEGFAVYASQGPVVTWSTDEEWSQQWDKFLRDYEAHVNRKRAEEAADTQALVRLMNARRDEITPETVSELDLDTWVTVDLYARAIEEETTDLVEGQKLKDPDAPNLDGNTTALLRQARDEATATRAGLDALALQFKDSYPETPDDDAEGWWAVTPDLILY